MVEEQIQQLRSAALARIEAAKDQEALEQVRVEVLGRKGSLAQFNVGKLPSDENAAMLVSFPASNRRTRSASARLGPAGSMAAMRTAKR